MDSREVSVRIPRSTYGRIKELKKEKGLTTSQLILSIIKDFDDNIKLADVLGGKLAEKIEKKRGSIPTKEFIGLCVDEYTRDETPRESGVKSNDYITRKDFEEFKSRNKEFFFALLRSLELEVGIRKETLEEARKHYQNILESPEEDQGLKEQIRNPPEPSSKNIQISRKEEAVKDKLPLLWIPAILLFGFGDGLTSVYAIARGAHEINPVFLINTFGNNIILFTVVKTIALVALLFLSFKIKQGWIIPSILSIAGACLIANNILVL